MAVSALNVENGKKAVDGEATWSTREVDTFLDVWGGGGPTTFGRLHTKELRVQQYHPQADRGGI